MTIAEFWQQEIDAGRSTVGLRRRFREYKRAEAEERNRRTAPERRRANRLAGAVCIGQRSKKRLAA